MKQKKYGRMDLLATINNGMKANIEVQIRDNHNTEERALYYTSGMYHESLKATEAYETIPKAIGIWILNYNLFKEEKAPFHEIIRLRRDYENKIFTKKMEMHFIQLSKFEKKKISNQLEEWLMFLKGEMTMAKSEEVKKAEEELEYLSGDEAVRRLAYLREKAIRDEAAAVATAKRMGREEGEKIGVAKGKIEGIQQKAIEVAKKMKEKNIDIATISEITGLSIEDIEKL